MSIINCVCSISVCHKQPITEGLDQANRKLTLALTCVISIINDVSGIQNMSRLNHDAQLIYFIDLNKPKSKHEGKFKFKRRKIC